MFENENFIGDHEKMRDFYELSKERFLQSYSYLTEAEYDNTARLVAFNNKEFYRDLMMEQQEQM